jgi:hypothetical protein
MFLPRHLLVPALAAGLLPAALSACGGTVTSRPAVSAKPATPTTASQVQSHMFSVVNGAKSVHVTGIYTWPHFKLTLDVGMLQSGQMAGFISNNGLPLSMIDVGGKMYVKATSALAAYYHQPGCAPVCGKYAIYPRHDTAGMVRSMGWKSTLNTLTLMGNDLFANPIHMTFHGQPALQMMASGYDPGAYVIVTATPQALPLEAVDPHHFKLAFSDWNSVPAPAAPPKSKIQRK